MAPQGRTGQKSKGPWPCPGQKMLFFFFLDQVGVCAFYLNCCAEKVNVQRILPLWAAQVRTKGLPYAQPRRTTALYVWGPSALLALL